MVELGLVAATAALSTPLCLGHVSYLSLITHKLKIIMDEDLLMALLTSTSAQCQ